jgi:arginine deiminase
MKRSDGVYVGSEIGALKKVLLHRPGRELKRITTDNKDEFLIDEIIWAERARENHDAFAALLRENGTEVVYFQDCLAETVRDKSLRSDLLDKLLALDAHDEVLKDALKNTVMDMTPDEVAETLVCGMTKSELAIRSGHIGSLAFRAASDSAFFFRPLPNLYFQRDPCSFVGNGVILSAMRFLARCREPLYAGYIFKNHPAFRNVRIIFGDEENDDYPNAIEGGDILVLNDSCVAIGISQRSEPGTVQTIGSRLASRIGIKKVLAVDIPKRRAYMHLDTVFTMVDVGAFILYPGIHREIRAWELDYGEDGRLLAINESSSFQDLLKKNLGLDKIRLIETGGGDLVEASRDQWNDGANTFAIRPGVVVTYESNTESNRSLRESGVTVHEINGSELGKGRGGPRCMSMPLLRESI